MLIIPITKLVQQSGHFAASNWHSKCLLPVLILTVHTKTCPTKTRAPICSPDKGKKSPPRTPKGPVCPRSGGTGSSMNVLKRELKTGKTRLGFIPEEWFLFFHSKTGVTGPYLFGIMLTNYLVSKEKFIMEHEYYVGLSIFVMLYYGSTTFGPTIGATLDKEVDAVAASFEKTRTDEMAIYNNIIMQAKDAQWRADGQKMLMDAKKENIAMQLEAVYRERLMQVYKTVKGRMDYHVKLHRAQARIQQKWMIGWILTQVMKSITPEIEQRALRRAIEDLAVAARRAT